jgi:photosystem II stability/assembly factor-like uncharacterized protein
MPSEILCLSYLQYFNTINYFRKIKNQHSMPFSSVSRILLVSLLFLAAANSIAQKIEILHDNRPVSLRGISVVDNKIIWVSGNKGTVGKSIDGGKTWSWIAVPGYENRDFRDIEAFDEHTAVIIAIAEPAHILRTADGGRTWTLTYENKSKGMFLDAMDFSDDLHGTVVGDAVSDKFFIAYTLDGGKNWKEHEGQYAAADSAEGCFASSGTNVRLVGKGNYFFVSGGNKSRLVSNSGSYEIPFDNSKSSKGANSLAVRKTKGKIDLWVVVGGDFTADSLRDRNCFISKDAGKSWASPQISPTGYRSCVEFISNTTLVACGLNGVDLSEDEGNTWKNISTNSFHACRKAKKGDAVFFSGSNGRIGKLDWD